MSPTITTTASPPTPRTGVQIVRIAGVVPASSGILLTSSSPGFPPPAAGAGATSSEPPPAKRPRLDPIPTNDNRYTECLRRQVFPHVDNQIAALPKGRVNTLSVGKQVGVS